MNEEYTNAFNTWLDKQYGNAHPSKRFMMAAWKAGARFAHIEISSRVAGSSQQGVENDRAKSALPLPYCIECGRWIFACKCVS